MYVVLRVFCMTCISHSAGRNGTQGRSELCEFLRRMTEFEKAAEERAEERELKRRKYDAELEE